MQRHLNCIIYLKALSSNTCLYLQFICGEKDWVNPRKALMDQGIQPISAGGEIIAKELSEFSEAAIEEVEKIIDAFHSKIQSQGTPYQSLYINNNVSSKKS